MEISSDSTHCIKCGANNPFSENNAIKRAQEEFIYLHRNVSDFLKTGFNLSFSLLLSTIIIFVLIYNVNADQFNVIVQSVSNILNLSEAGFKSQYHSGFILSFIVLISWLFLALILKIVTKDKAKLINKTLLEMTQIIRLFLEYYQEKSIAEDTISSLQRFSSLLEDAKKRHNYKENPYNYTFLSRILFLTETRVYGLFLVNLVLLIISCYLVFQTSPYLSAFDSGSEPVKPILFFLELVVVFFLFSSIYYFNINYYFTVFYSNYINNLQVAIKQRIAGEDISLPFSGYVMASYKSFVPKYS